jgi:hypothetical protein
MQRWASFPPEVTVKSLPLPTNLKIVRLLRSCYLPEKTLKRLHRSRYLLPPKFETVKSLFSQLSLKKVTVIRCRYSTEFKKETVKSLNC